MRHSFLQLLFVIGTLAPTGSAMSSAPIRHTLESGPVPVVLVPLDPLVPGTSPRIRVTFDKSWASDVIVGLSSDSGDVTVPASKTLVAGRTSFTFRASVNPMATDDSVTLTATTADGYASTWMAVGTTQISTRISSGR